MKTTPNGRGFESYSPSRKVFVNIDRAKHIQMGAVSERDSIVDKIQFTLPGSSIIKDDLAVLDIIANNINDRPIYFAVTCRPEKMQGLDDFMQLEGLAVRIVPVKSQSERAFGLIGSGRVATEKVFERVTKKFRWGNFDKEKTYINTSYQPSVQTTEFTILRTALEMARQKDTVRAAELLDKKFEAFPNFNFPYSAENDVFFLDAYIRAG
ncbi:MAG: DUF2723 domain-containing protein, partial [Saprospiraceae bacterium]|nr:DUF2723 domain-containing protein [Saprospiraceae bacterium]